MSNPATAAALINLRGVTKAYQTAAGDYLALRGIDLQIAAGEFVAIVGRSGSGKSTLINLITAIDRASSGSVSVAGTELTTLPESRMATWRGRTVGIVFQFFQLLPTLTVRENVMLPMDFAGIGNARQRRERADELLERVDMLGRADRLPAELSGGQQQRVAIARALANRPPLVVADEPTGNLDSRTADAVFHLFEELAAQGTTIVMVTHDSELAQRAARQVTVADGLIVA
jgi:putative ABC transport system ATP-binding protein